MITGCIKNKILAALDKVAVASSRNGQNFGRIWVGSGGPASSLFAPYEGKSCGVTTAHDEIIIDIPMSGYSYNFANRLFITIHEYGIYCSRYDMHSINWDTTRGDTITNDPLGHGSKLVGCGREVLGDQYEFDINSPDFNDTIIYDIADKVVTWVECWIKQQ